MNPWEEIVFVKGESWVSVTQTHPREHYWIEAPERLRYLRTPHFHNFGITVGISCKKDNREIAMEDLQVALDRAFQSIPQIVPWSCETFAKKIAKRVVKQLKRMKNTKDINLIGRTMYVSVSEDGTQGAYYNGEICV